MTSRDHLLGHAPAAQFDGPDWGSFYPLGIPRRIEDEFEVVNYGGLKPPPTLATLLPTGTIACTVHDRMGLEARFDIRNARLQSLAPPPKVAEQLAIFNEFAGGRINHDVAEKRDYMVTTIHRGGLVIEQIVKAGAGQAWGE